MLLHINRFKIVLLALVIISIISGNGCRRNSTVRGARSPEQAFTDLAQLVREHKTSRIYDLLDNESRWSLMTILRDQRAICDLVRTQYPQNRQARELLRCQLSARAKDARDLFEAYARAYQVLTPLEHLSSISKKQGTFDRVEIESQGVKLMFCREGAGWFFCGLRSQLEALKVKSARDLISIKENADSFKGR